MLPKTKYKMTETIPIDAYYQSFTYLPLRRLDIYQKQMKMIKAISGDVRFAMLRVRPTFAQFSESTERASREFERFQKLYKGNSKIFT